MFLEMRFCDVSEVPEKSVFTRLFDLFATAMLANFQDRLVMTTSITLRIGFFVLRVDFRNFRINFRYDKKVYKESAKKSSVARLFEHLSSSTTTNFQDRLVMTASICLRVLSFRTWLLYHKTRIVSSAIYKKVKST